MSTSRGILLVALAVIVVDVGSAVAHDGHDHIIMGTVMARDDKHLEVKTPGGEVLWIAITDKTTTTRDKKKFAFRDLQVGTRVVVNIGNGEDPLIAKDIQVGVAPATAAPKH